MTDPKARLRRHRRIRKKVAGTADRPRLAVFRSNRHLYAQLIDDLQGHTLAAASSVEESLRGSSHDVERAAAVGRLVAERALEKGIKQAVFDRGGYQYHGMVKALGDAARKNGLEF